MPTVFAVVTTGIYCRPTCGAQPRPGNVRSFPLAAAAEAAGYRACLRCRPYRAPQSVPWTGPELVCRAVRLILDGALDAATEAQLGHRLGVSARHLRRLFMAHLGVTPDGLARSARTHFARRLLDDTDLTITEIAFAVGFGSLRQFNRACQEVFRAPPHVLRAKRRKADRLVADGGLLLRLAFSGALDWDATVAYLAARATPGVEHVSVSDGVYRRTVTIAGDPGVLELYPGADDHLLLRAHLPHWEELVHLVNRARRIANLDLDLDEPARQLAADPVIGPLLQARPGVRPPGTFDPFETGVRAIIGQRAAIATANAITGRMVERLGAPVPGLRRIGLTHTFPHPATLAAADLSGLGLSSTRQTAIRAFAQAVAEGAVPLDRSVSLDRLVGAIGELDGLGPRTAHYLAFRLGEPDAWPMSGRDLQRILAGNAHNAHHARKDRRTHRADAALADRWRPWRALAAAHLWMVNGWQQVLLAGTAPTEAKEQPHHG
ncbi:MAG TPA: AlkA N-terminal domain-containing protein [Pseudonocardiaceae bacterium]|jgi:AraC family transcriptional regulator of adaptative response / DNA-3-methyladenine glycosylase II